MRFMLAIVMAAAILAGAGLGLVAQEWTAVTPEGAAARAIAWLQDLGYPGGAITSVERHWPLRGVSIVRPVYVVSAWLYLAAPGQVPARMCAGVAVDAWSGRVLGMHGGEVPWLRC